MDIATTLDFAFWITAGSILLLLVCSGFFSGSETALTAASRGKLRTIADKGGRGANVALELLSLLASNKIPASSITPKSKALKYCPPLKFLYLFV